jgi:N-acylneuraminate cytidylyltransferase
MNDLAIIPARKGSKRLPNKNRRDFLGKPTLVYSIEAALESNLFKEIMVSTDDEETAEIAIKFGASVPFLRSIKNSSDYATTYQVIEEVLHNYGQLNKEFENACCIYASPFITSIRLIEAKKLLVQENADTVIPIVEFASNILRALTISDNKVRMISPENINVRSQDLNKFYHDAGKFYYFNTKKLLENGMIFSDNNSYILIPEVECHDINTETDWELAKLKYKFLNGYEC